MEETKAPEVPSDEKLLGAEKPVVPPTDYKIAEIWIRSSGIDFSAVPEMFNDKLRSIGILEYCKDVIKEGRIKEDEKPAIITQPGGMMNFVRSGFKRNGKKK